MPQFRASFDAPRNSISVRSASPSYVGLDHLQEQARVKSLREGSVFNLMVAGRSGLGKSTLVYTLFKSEVSPRAPGSAYPIPSTTKIESTTSELNEDGVKLTLNITDTPGFGDNINNENCWEPLVKYIEEQYSKYLQEEQKIERKQKIPDSRVHACLYFIQPNGHSLISLDIEVLKRLDSIVNVIPVIAKSDTLTLEERKFFKERIQADLAAHGIKGYPVSEFDDPLDISVNNKIRENIPFAVVGSSVWHEVNGRKLLGRKTSGGLVEVDNKNHCEFYLLRDLLIRTHMRDLIDTTASHHYESFRRVKLNPQNKESAIDKNEMKSENSQQILTEE